MNILLTTRQIIVLFLLSTIISCVTVPSDFVEPGVSVTSFNPEPGDGISPRFKIVLHITNPNRDPLALEGIAYSILLEGNEVMSGVSNELPTIEPYGEDDVTLYATANLFGGIKLMTGLMSNQSKHINYEFKAKLDVGTFMPRIDVVKKGTL